MAAWRDHPNGVSWSYVVLLAVAVVIALLIP